MIILRLRQVTCFLVACVVGWIPVVSAVFCHWRRIFLHAV